MEEVLPTPLSSYIWMLEIGNAGSDLEKIEIS